MILNPTPTDEQASDACCPGGVCVADTDVEVLIADALYRRRNHLPNLNFLSLIELLLRPAEVTTHIILAGITRICD